MPARPGGSLREERGGCLTSINTSKAIAMNEILREDFMATETRVINMNQIGRALNEMNDPPVQSLFVYTSNPAAVAPDQNEVLRGLPEAISSPWSMSDS